MRSAILAWLVLVTACGPSIAERDAGPTPQYETPQGQTVELAGSTDELVALLDWAFGRFTRAGLDEPVIATIDFEADVPRCDRRAGWAVTSEEGSEVGVCLSTDQLCRQIDSVPLTSIGKMCILHELAHVWLFDHVSPATRSAFLDHASLDEWIDTTARWHERGVEYAAETVAWGLMDRRPRMIRIGEPGAGHLAVGFSILTGTEPLVSPNDTDP